MRRPHRLLGGRERTLARHRSRARNLRQPKIEHLDAQASIGRSRQEQVLGFDVAVHDATRVRFADRIASLNHPVDRVLERARLSIDQSIRQVFTFEELEDKERRAALQTSDVENATDMRALYLEKDAGLSLESSHSLGVRAERRHQELDRYALVEIEMPRLDDEPHSAFADHTLDAILAVQHRAGCDKLL